MTEEKLGTENIKAVLEAVFSFTGNVMKHHGDDGKIDAKESVQLVVDVIKRIGVIKKAKTAIAEGKDIDTAEAVDLLQWIAVQLKDNDILDIDLGTD